MSRCCVPFLVFSVLSLACAHEPQPKLATLQYRSFPRTARVPKLCLIHTHGMNNFSQKSQGATFSFDPSAKLATALLEGLKLTCQRTALDSRAANAAELDFDREIGVVGEVTNASLRQGFNLGGNDEVKIQARIQITDSGDAEPLQVVEEGHTVQLSSFNNVAGAIAVAFVEVADAVNQCIFDQRRRLGDANAQARAAEGGGD